MLSNQVHRIFYYFLHFIFVVFFIIYPASAKLSRPQQVTPGTLSYARLETAITVENQDALIKATITSGKYNGAILQGKLTTDSDLPILHFTSIRQEKKWSHPKPINAYAIDVDIVRTALLRREESAELAPEATKLAASFLQVYTKADKIKMGAGNDLGILFLPTAKG